jgi:MYXO-CTERM domain-containing protein
MKLTALALAAAVSSAASATFVEYVTVKTSTTNSGVALDVYVLYARFNGATDTVLNAFNFNAVGGATTNGFYHKDNATSNSGVLQKSFGTWSPGATGSATANRPFDSYLTIGGLPTATNSSSADPSWNSGGTGAHAGGSAGWTRPDLLNNGVIGWFNGSPPNNQGRVGLAGNTATDVRLGQFVVDAGANAGTWTLTTAYNNGVAGSAVQFANGSFSLGGAVPAPGALALLGLAGFAGRRRR